MLKLKLHYFGPLAKSWLIGKNPVAGKDWRQEEKGMTEDEMVGWHHQLNGHEFEETPGETEGQGSLVCCSPWGRSVRHDWVTEQQQQCVKSSLVLLKKVFAMIGVFSWQNSVSLWPALFCTPRPNLPVTPGISWLPTFAFQSPMMKRTSFLTLVLESLVGTGQLQHLWHQWLGHVWYGCILSCVRLFVAPWTIAYQAPLPKGFPRWECWSGLPLGCSFKYGPLSSICRVFT